jgi:hypothetical protein
MVVYSISKGVGLVKLQASRAVKSERQLPKQEPRCVVTLLLQRFAYRTVELTVRVQKKTAYRFERSCTSQAHPDLPVFTLPANFSIARRNIGS